MEGVEQGTEKAQDFREPECLCMWQVTQTKSGAEAVILKIECERKWRTLGFGDGEGEEAVQRGWPGKRWVTVVRWVWEGIHGGPWQETWGTVPWRSGKGWSSR